MNITGCENNDNKNPLLDVSCVNQNELKYTLHKSHINKLNRLWYQAQQTLAPHSALSTSARWRYSTVGPTLRHFLLQWSGFCPNLILNLNITWSQKHWRSILKVSRHQLQPFLVILLRQRSKQTNTCYPATENNTWRSPTGRGKLVCRPIFTVHVVPAAAVRYFPGKSWRLLRRRSAVSWQRQRRTSASQYHLPTSGRRSRPVIPASYSPPKTRTETAHNHDVLNTVNLWSKYRQIENVTREGLSAYRAPLL